MLTLKQSPAAIFSPPGTPARNTETAKKGNTAGRMTLQPRRRRAGAGQINYRTINRFYHGYLRASL